MRLGASPRRDELSPLTISRRRPYHIPYHFSQLSLPQLSQFNAPYTSLQVSSAVPQTPCSILSGRTSSRTAGKHSRGSRPLSPLVLLGKLLQDGRSKLRALSPLSQSISPCAPSSAHLLSPLNRRLLAVPRSSRTFRLHNLPPLFRPNAVQYGPNPTSTRSHITSLPTP
jgi:hypothetical protein